MPGLPKSIIKKYGVTKKAWAVYRGKKSRKKTSKRSVMNVARRRRRRTYAKSVSYRRRSTAGNPMVNKLVGAMVYGAGRGFVSSKLAPITSRVPFGEISDEVVMLGLSYALAKGKIPFINKIGMSRKIGNAGFIIESAMIGSYLGGRIGTSTSVAGSKIF